MEEFISILVISSFALVDGVPITLFSLSSMSLVIGVQRRDVIAAAAAAAAIFIGDDKDSFLSSIESIDGGGGGGGGGTQELELSSLAESNFAADLDSVIPILFSSADTDTTTLELSLHSSM